MRRVRAEAEAPTGLSWEVLVTGRGCPPSLITKPRPVPPPTGRSRDFGRRVTARAEKTPSRGRRCGGRVRRVPTTYRIAEAAALLGVSDDTVRRWIDSDRLAASREAGPAQVDGADLA